MSRVKIELPGWASEFTKPVRYKVAYGGRGSGKSTTFARLLILEALRRPLRVLCARELQNSIQDSVHQLIADQIAAMGLEGHFTVQEKKIYSAAGAEFMFKGIRGTRGDASQLKSLEGVDVCWIEEGQTVSKASWETLKPTIRKPGSEIWVTFNPDNESDPVYQEFVAKPAPPNSIVRKVNWNENPWFPPELDEERRHMLRTDPDLYQHVWEGACRQVSDAQVFRGKWRVDAFDAPENTVFYFGLDWGFANDPTALVRCWIQGNRLMVDWEAGGTGIEIDHVPQMIRNMPQADRYVIRADSARPESISYVARQGLRIMPAEKWPGSVEDGIAFLRSFDEIVVHERCRRTIEEFTLYRYKVDARTGDVLPKLEDAHNHWIDALRYALAPMIRNRRLKTLGMKTGVV